MRFSMACKLVEKIRKTKTASGFEAVKQHSAHVILNALDFISILFFHRGVGRKRDPATPTAGEVFQKQQQNHRPG